MNKYSKILVPIDGSDQSYKAVQNAGLIAKFSNADVIVIIVVDSNYDILDDRQEIDERNQKIFKKASSLLNSEIISKMKILVGDPRHEIVNYAKESCSDLIVIGATGKRFFDKILIGSTTDYVINHSPCDIFVSK